MKFPNRLGGPVSLFVQKTVGVRVSSGAQVTCVLGTHTHGTNRGLERNQDCRGHRTTEVLERSGLPVDTNQPLGSTY